MKTRKPIHWSRLAGGPVVISVDHYKTAVQFGTSNPSRGSCATPPMSRGAITPGVPS